MYDWYILSSVVEEIVCLEAFAAGHNMNMSRSRRDDSTRNAQKSSHFATGSSSIKHGNGQSHRCSFNFSKTDIPMNFHCHVRLQNNQLPILIRMIQKWNQRENPSHVWCPLAGRIRTSRMREKMYAPLGAMGTILVDSDWVGGFPTLEIYHGLYEHDGCDDHILGYVGWQRTWVIIMFNGWQLSIKVMDCLMIISWVRTPGTSAASPPKARGMSYGPWWPMDLLKHGYFP